MKRRLATLAVALAPLAPAPAAHADPAPQAGQPCNYPSQILMVGFNLTARKQIVPDLLCGPEVHRWVLWDGEGLSTSESETIGAPCHVPLGFLAMAITPVPDPLPPDPSSYEFPPDSGVYLAMCQQGKWTPYHP